MTSANAKPNVLVLGPKVPDVLDPVNLFANALPRWEYASLAECRVAAGGDFQGIVTLGRIEISKQMLDELPALEIIACCSVGYDGVDIEAATEKSVRVTNTPDVLTDDVADLAVGLAIAARRRIVGADRYVREGRWESEGPMPFTQRIHGKAVGIAGLGRIGRAVARRLEGFNCDIGYCDVAKLEVSYRYYEDLVSLAKASDMLIVTMPGGRATKGVINHEVIEALGVEGCLINVSRGSVVDQHALIRALEAGQLGTAALDVFAEEPNVPEQLKMLDNVVLQPHHASGTWETRYAMRDLVVENLRRHFEGRPLKTPVN